MIQQQQQIWNKQTMYESVTIYMNNDCSGSFR